MLPADDDVENEETEREHERSLDSLSMFYGLFITMTGFACSLAPIMVASDDSEAASSSRAASSDQQASETRQVELVAFIFEAYTYVTSAAWLVFMFLRILNNATRISVFTRRRFTQRLAASNNYSEHDSAAPLATISNDYSLNVDKRPSADDGFPNRAFDADPDADAEVAKADDAGQLQPQLSEASSENEPPKSEFVELHKRVQIASPESVIDLSLSGRVKRASDANARSTSVSTMFNHDASSYRMSHSADQSGAIHLASGESVSPSFYLRIGNIAFGVGAITNMVFYILMQMEDAIVCKKSDITLNVLESILGVVKIFFLFAQAFFIFKHSKVSIIKHQLLARFAQMHLIATNICAWFDTVVTEAVHSSSHGSDTSSSTESESESESESGQYSGNESRQSRATVSDGCQRQLYDLYYNSLLAYFSPLTIEYSLIAAVSCYIIYQNIGIAAKISRSSISETMRKVARTRFSVDCSKSIRGMFSGIVVVIVSIVVLIVVSNNDSYVTAYYAAIDVMVVTALVATAMAFRAMRQLDSKHSEHENERTTPDSILLMVSLSGVLLNVMFVLISTLGQKDVALCVLQVLWALSTAVQAVAQVFLVFFSETRHCKSREQQKLKPGRGAVLFLLLANFALWLDHSFVSRSVLLNEETEAVPLFNATAYQIIISVTLPLLIFFRFHSTACLSEVWRHVYALPKKRH